MIVYSAKVGTSLNHLATQPASPDSPADRGEQCIHRLYVLEQLSRLRYCTLLASSVGVRPYVAAALVVQSLDLGKLTGFDLLHSVKSSN